MKDFTLYPEALELKELGFDEPCFAWYHLGDTLLSDITMGYEKTDFLYTQDDMEETQCTAPTYSQAFRWFREKYDLDYSLLPESSSGHRLSTRTFNIVIYKYHMNMNVQAETVRIDGKIARYNKREEAELACLREMIKIVKTTR